MKASEGFIFRRMRGTGVVVPVGEQSRDFKGMVTLNETGTFLWEKLQQETDRDGLIAALRAEYDTDPETAARDVDAFLEKATKAGILAP